MTAFSNRRLRVFLVSTVILSFVAAHGQATQAAPERDALSVTLKMQSDRIQVGQMPWAILTIDNQSDQPVDIRDSMYRVYVYGRNGEAPTTPIQRQLTGRPNPGDVELPHGPDAGPSRVWPAGGPGDSCVRKFELAYLYDLSAPGRYTAYAEVMDPSSRRWLRTKTVTFEMKAPPQ
ncbi:MAG TPA: hypothetical protein VIY53_19480 [Acidobacteriaceae bacterium]